MARPSIMNDIPFDLSFTLASPSSSHVLGQDAFGRDLFNLILASTGQSLGLGLLCAATTLFFSVLIATIWTITPKFLKWIPSEMMRFLWVFPNILITLVILSTHGGGTLILILSIGIGSAPYLAQLLIAKAQAVLKEDYCSASIALGAHPFQLWCSHVFPELTRFLTWKSPQLVMNSILAEAILTFLGIGSQPHETTWGTLILQAKDYLWEAPHIMLSMTIPLLLVSTFTSKLSAR